MHRIMNSFQKRNIIFTYKVYLAMTLLEIHELSFLEEYPYNTIYLLKVLQWPFLTKMDESFTLHYIFPLSFVPRKFLDRNNSCNKQRKKV